MVRTMEMGQMTENLVLIGAKAQRTTLLMLPLTANSMSQTKSQTMTKMMIRTKTGVT